MNNSYIAGFTDADGSISVNRVGKLKTGKDVWTYGVSLVNTNREVLTQIRDYLGVGKIYSSKGKKANHSTTYRLVFKNRNEVLVFLKRVVNHLVVKKTQGRAMFNLSKSRQRRCPKRGQHTPYTKKEYEYMITIKRANMAASFRSKDFKKIPFI